MFLLIRSCKPVGDNSVGQPGKSGGYTIYQGGNKGMELGSGDAPAQASVFITQLNQMWPGAAAAFNGNVKRMHWPTYEFTKGSYACYKVGQIYQYSRRRNKSGRQFSFCR